MVCVLAFYADCRLTGMGLLRLVSTSRHGRCDISESAGITDGTFCNPIMKGSGQPLFNERLR